MTDIQWADEDDVEPANTKYPQMLTAIKKATLDDREGLHRWAKIASFGSEGTGRELANRLGNSHDEFYFIARKLNDMTNVFAKLKEEVTE